MAVACLKIDAEGIGGGRNESGAKGWHLLKTKPCKEAYVQMQLSACADLETYFPRMKTPRKYLRPRQPQFEAVFPGYVFVRLCLETDLAQLRRLRGYDSLVCFDGRPAAVSSELIREFRRREGRRGYIVHRPETGLRPDDPVRITAGSFRGQTARFLRYSDGARRICVLLELMNVRTALELPAGAVEAVAV